MNTFRYFAKSMAQTNKAKKRQPLWSTSLRTLAEDWVPERLGR
jgi:hypothetical protein